MLGNKYPCITRLLIEENNESGNFGCRPKKENKDTYQLLLLKTILEEGEVGGDTIITVVQETDHTLGIHRLTNEEFVVLEKRRREWLIRRDTKVLAMDMDIYLEVTQDLLDESSSTLFEGRDTLRVGFLELLLQSLHVTLDVAHVGLLVKGSLGKTERVDNVVDGLSRLLNTFVTTFSRGVGTDINITFLDSDHL